MSNKINAETTEAIRQALAQEQLVMNVGPLELLDCRELAEGVLAIVYRYTTADLPGMDYSVMTTYRAALYVVEGRHLTSAAVRTEFSQGQP